jgi:ribulose-phosphate 3-epimerase
VRNVRIGSALFNADHTRLGDELRRTETAGVDFFHMDVFDGYFVQDQAFPARTIKALRGLTQLPFEIHLAVNDPLRFLPQLKDAGADLVFLPAESTPLLYETIYSVREKGMKAGLCLALGTPLNLLSATLPMIDAVLLLGRVTGEGKRGRDFNQLVVQRVREVRRMIDAAGLNVDLQAAGGLETENCVEVRRAGATSLPNLIAGDERKQEKVSGKVLVASRSFGKNCPEVLDEMKAAGCVFLPQKFDGAPTEDQLIAAIKDADVLISGTEPVTETVLAAAKKLKVISKHGVGVDNIDLAAAKARGIPVAVAGPAMVDAVADLTMGLILALARQIPQANANVKAGKWDRFVGPELRGKVLGVVGFGQIGRAVARRAEGFGMKVIAHDAFPAPGFEYASLEQLLKAADFVSIHAPLTRETRNMFGAEQFRQMKPTAFLVNVARGELVDEAALFEALKAKRIAGAATDVFVKEPPGKNPLLELEDFIAMPHCGGQTPEALRRMGQITAENALRVLRGEKPLYQVV